MKHARKAARVEETLSPRADADSCLKRKEPVGARVERLHPTYSSIITVFIVPQAHVSFCCHSIDYAG